jgi:hypothetical protein
VELKEVDAVVAETQILSPTFSANLKVSKVWPGATTKFAAM